MNAKEALVEIKKLIFSEAEKEAAFALVEGKLVDGTIVAYDLEAGEIFVVGEDGSQIPAPVGEHQLESGEVVVVLEEGKIAEIKKAEEEPKIEVEIQASEEVAIIEEEPKKDEAMAKVEQAMGDLEKKVEELAAKVEEMAKKNEAMKAAVQLSAEVIESLAKDPSDKPISAPNTFAKSLKSEKDERYSKIQNAFKNLKNK